MEIKYTKTHEWVKFENGEAYVGITDHAQSALGDLVYIELPQEGGEVAVGEPFAEVESVKAASEVFSPVSGVVSEVNDKLADEPESINSEPYESWMMKVTNVSETADFLTEEEYTKYLEEEV